MLKGPRENAEHLYELNYPVKIQLLPSNLKVRPRISRRGICIRRYLGFVNDSLF